MDRHVSRLGILNLLYGVWAFLTSVSALGLAGGVTELYYRTETTGAAFVIVGIVLLNLLLSIPCIVFGIFVRQYHDSARYAGIVISAINILALPFGTLIGAYSLWVLLSPETEMLFLHPLPRRRRRETHEEEDEQELDSRTRHRKAAVKPRESGLTS